MKRHEDVWKYFWWLKIIQKEQIMISVIYWPSTEPSIKRCTSVNKQKNSGSMWTLENNITRSPGGSSQLETGCEVRTSCRQRALGPQWPTVEQPQPRWGGCAAMLERRIWVNIAVRPCLHSFLTHNKHHPFENKVSGIYIFIKKCIGSLLKSSLSVDYVPVYICIRVVYNTTIRLRLTWQHNIKWRLSEECNMLTVN